MKQNIFYLTFFIAFVAFTSCNKEKMPLDLNEDVNIYSFVINGKAAAINNDTSTITLILPFGTDLSSLAPEITLGKNATVQPESGVAIDFSNSALKDKAVKYTVKNGNIYQEYKVIVDVARAKITSFRIGGVEAFEINETERTIDIYLPVGTDVTELIPVVQYTEGAVISPADNTPVDFTNPVIYTLEYENSIFTYTVTVHFGDEPVRPILLYNGEQETGVNWTPLASDNFNAYTANPDKTGINPSAVCMSVLRVREDVDPNGKPWTGAFGWNVPVIDPAKYGTMKIKVLKEVAGHVTIEVQSTGETNKDWLRDGGMYTEVGQWQELTFTIPSTRTAPINNVLIEIHDEAAGTFATQRMYWDDVIVYPR
jgi:hypothetical protein